MVGFVALSFIEWTAEDEPARDDRCDIARIDRSASTITRALTPPRAPVIGEDERMIADTGGVGGAAAAAAANLLTEGQPHAQGSGYQDRLNKLASEDGTHSIPFYGEHQAGIATPPQTAGAFLSFDVTAGNRRELADLFRTLTERAAFLTNGGTRPESEHLPLLGSTVLPDDLTVTVALGASLFDDRFGLARRKPAQLEAMRAFAHDDLDPKITHGDCWCNCAPITATPSGTRCSTLSTRPAAACGCGGAWTRSGFRRGPSALRGIGWGSRTASPTPTRPTRRR
jgi:Dyp-type peroxidase family